VENPVMCGRYAFLLPPEAMAELFKILNEAMYPPRYNIAPTQPVTVIVEREGRRTAELFRWGFVPAWTKDPREMPLLINARAESMAEKPAFRDAVRNSRCLVPASGYYEWRRHPDGSRRPYYITTADNRTMAFAGLYSTWSGPNGEEVDTVCIVTVRPNAELSHIHDRMPALLTGDDVDAWLDRGVSGPKALPLAAPAPDGTMAFHPVGPEVGNANADHPGLIVPFTGEWDAPRPKQRAGGAQMELF
jgi:putative SOS response-associated peptidase YedK